MMRTMSFLIIQEKPDEAMMSMYITVHQPLVHHPYQIIGIQPGLRLSVFKLAYERKKV